MSALPPRKTNALFGGRKRPKTSTRDPKSSILGAKTSKSAIRGAKTSKSALRGAPRRTRRPITLSRGDQKDPLSTGKIGARRPIALTRAGRVRKKKKGLSTKASKRAALVKLPRAELGDRVLNLEARVAELEKKNKILSTQAGHLKQLTDIY